MSMFYFSLKIYFKILAATWTIFGVNKTFVRILFFWPLNNFINSIFFLLDNLFYPGYRREKVEKPVIIIGHPRSGSTFLHRVLTQTHDFVCFEFWQILFPSLVGRKISSPIIRFLIKRGKDVIIPEKAGHKQLLGSVEEEELLLYKLLNTPFVAVYTPLAFSDSDFDELVYADRQPLKIRRKTTGYLRKCFKRQMYYLKKRQVVANMNFSAMRIQSLLEEFPDARIIYLVRSPYETIPSHLTLDRQVFDHLWGLEHIPPEPLNRYFERRYQYDVEYYRYIEDLIENGVLTPSQFMSLTYDVLKNDLEGAIKAIVEFTGIELSKELNRKIQKQVEAQQSYRHKHSNLTFEDFGLSKERIANDLSFVFDKYGFEK